MEERGERLGSPDNSFLIRSADEDLAALDSQLVVFLAKLFRDIFQIRESRLVLYARVNDIVFFVRDHMHIGIRQDQPQSLALHGIHINRRQANIPSQLADALAKLNLLCLRVELGYLILMAYAHRYDGAKWFKVRPTNTL